MIKVISKRYLLIFFLLPVISIAGSNRLFAQFATQKFDDRILIDLQDNRTPGQTNFFLFMSNTNKYVNIGVPAALLVGGIIDHNEAMRQNSLYVASSSAVSYGLDYLIKHIVKRPRPFIQNIKIVPVYRAGGTSFPSGHASSSISTATALSIAYPKWYVIVPSFLWAGTISYSRMYLGEHYPSDVAAGDLLGAGSAVSLMFLKK
jgi:membrane-associated phospholipid phosphatase